MFLPQAFSLRTHEMCIGSACSNVRFRLTYVRANMPSWVCPTCLTELNAAPYGTNEGANQGNDHLKGKRHLRRMKAVDMSNEDVYRRFCIKIGRSVPDFHATSPIHDFKDYTDECGGNGKMTIENFAAPPPPLPREDGRRPRIKYSVRRNIYSEPFATVIPTSTTPMVGGRKFKVRMLCCFDDKNTCNGCVREHCPFAHATKFAEQYPEAEADLYAVMPCNFAGMEGGCRYHQCKFIAHDWNWTVPLFRLTATDSPRNDERAVMPELLPFYDGAKWSLRYSAPSPCPPADRDFNEHLEYVVRRFLDGSDYSDNEHSEKE